MIRFNKLDVLQLAARSLSLRWELENIPAGYTEYLTIHRSESPEGPWEELATRVTGTDTYHDHRAEIYHPNVTIYYKITGVVENGTGDSQAIKESDVVHLQHKPDAIALNIIRQQRLLLRKKNGSPGYFLIRRTWGTKCTACYNESLDAVMSSDCSICFNTKYVGGYYTPVFAYCANTNIGKSEQRGEGQSFFDTRQVFWATNSPELKKGDIWVDSTGTRWVIEKIQLQTTKLRTVLRQIFIADEIPASDVLYKIPVPSVFSLERDRGVHYWRATTPYGN